MSLSPDQLPFGETTETPQQVDFKGIAAKALQEGIFDQAIESPDAENMPKSLLDAPYGNGPLSIEVLEQDVPVVAMNAVRKNFTKANRLLAPTDQVGLYFCHKFASDSALSSSRLQDAVEGYHPYDKNSYNKDRGPAIPPFSVEDPGRKAHDRHLYTREEREASWDFTIEQPEAVLSILVYKSVMQDYFADLSAAYARRGDVTADQIEQFERNYVAQWDTDNFTSALVPALTILHKNAQAQNVELNHEFFDQELFRQAFAMVLDNGAFRNWVSVPAHVSQDGQARTNKFLCPAVGPVRDHLSEGSILAKLYDTIHQKAEAQDPTTLRMLDSIRLKAAEARDALTEEEEYQEYLARVEHEKHYDVEVDGTSVSVRVDYPEYGNLVSNYTENDTVIQYNFSHTLTDVLRMAFEATSRSGKPSFFTFNDEGYRVTSDDIRRIATTQYPDMFI